jgi:hypothetical protein
VKTAIKLCLKRPVAKEEVQRCEGVKEQGQKRGKRIAPPRPLIPNQVGA